MNNKLRA